MLRYAIFATALSLSGFSATHKKEMDCPEGKRHYRTTVRHIESGGIGYEDGYTTFEMFFASSPYQWVVTPFLDARAHIFDNGKWGANLGAGLRSLWKNRAYGLNAYYDYRGTGRLHANQIGAGLETLGELFDFRINGYLPLGKKTSAPYSASFAGFSGNYMYTSEIYQSAMKGANAEFGFHFGKTENFDFYAAFGPYYFIGEVAPATWGGKARVSGTYKETLSIEISDSYDRTFHNKFQGQIGLSFAFGPRSKVKEQGRTCKAASMLNNRMLQPVDRQEIIVIDKTKKKSVAIDPATGLPYFFVFVNNTSSSNGSYESPYHSFAQAEANSSPNDVIYVFPGDGTTTGMNAGITLKANQKLLGSGINQLLQTSLGTISIPAQSNASPVITNSDADTEGNAVTLATNNEVSGFTIASSLNDGIFGENSQSLTVTACTFENTTTFPIEAAFGANASISITNNQFFDNANGISLTLEGSTSLVCSNNTFTGQTSVSNVPIEVTADSNAFSAYIQNNLFDSNETGSIRFALNSAASANINLLNNTMTNNGTGSQSSLASSVVLISSGTIDQCSIVLNGNIFSGNGSNALYLHTSGDFNILEVTASSNTISDIGASGIVLATPASNLTFLATGNAITECGDNGIAVIASGSTSEADITISNNTITDVAGNGISANQDFTSLNFTVSNNAINGCDGTGIISYSPNGIDSLTLNITDNTISNCQNMSANAASGLDIEQFADMTGSVANNVLSDNAGAPFMIGSTLTAPAACLTLTGNSSSAGYLLTNPVDGLFYLSPCNVDSVNIGTIDAPDITDIVISCPAAVPCSP